jgi:hypothetical protein
MAPRVLPDPVPGGILSKPLRGERPGVDRPRDRQELRDPPLPRHPSQVRRASHAFPTSSRGGTRSCDNPIPVMRFAGTCYEGRSSVRRPESPSVRWPAALPDFFSRRIFSTRPSLRGREGACFAAARGEAITAFGPGLGEWGGAQCREGHRIGAGMGGRCGVTAIVARGSGEDRGRRELGPSRHRLRVRVRRMRASGDAGGSPRIAAGIGTRGGTFTAPGADS